jgi:hypothetical protein
VLFCLIFFLFSSYDGVFFFRVLHICCRFSSAYGGQSHLSLAVDVSVQSIMPRLQRQHLYHRVTDAAVCGTVVPFLSRLLFVSLIFFLVVFVLLLFLQSFLLVFSRFTHLSVYFFFFFPELVVAFDNSVIAHLGTWLLRALAVVLPPPPFVGGRLLRGTTVRSVWRGVRALHYAAAAAARDILFFATATDASVDHALARWRQREDVERDWPDVDAEVSWCFCVIFIFF